MNLESCQSCNEPTKRPAGFYDRQGPGGTLEGGVMYACDNMDCPLSKERLEGYERARVQKQETQRENAAHGICPDDARQERIYAEITGYEMAKRLGVSPSLVCDWEQERKPWPVDMYERYMAVVSEKEARNG